MILTRFFLAATLGVAVFWAGSAASADEPALAKPVDFAREIRPILSDRCFKCHGPALQEGELRLDVREAAIRSKAIIPDRPQASKLLKKVREQDEDNRMPPAEAGNRLTSEQIATLERWIAQGAEYAPHWAFQPLKSPTLPKVKNGIDHFIVNRIREEGLQPSPPTDRVTLIRRVSLDLLGLPPTPAEVDAFVQDQSPDAYEKLVDRLLASPHYGERQARHWLDLARYADSNGYTIDGPRSIWPYRDWVINAFNRDLSFDQFTAYQLAGDLLPKSSQDMMVATGFHRNTSFNEEGGTDPEQFRIERVLDRTNVTGTVWLGLTVGCAQCHDHKYDPISQKEYYQLYAFFNSSDEPALPLPNPEEAKKLAELKEKLKTAKVEAKAKAEAEKGKPKPSVAEQAESLRAESQGGWKTLEPIEVKSDQGATLTVLDDKSILASGPVGDADTYTIMTRMPEGTISAIRLEALTHPSLPKQGPGRANNGNFVMSHFVMQVDGTLVPMRKAIADHSQKKHGVENALKGDAKKGWAINVEPGKGSANVDRQAIFVLESPVPRMEGRTLVFRIKFSEQPKRYTLGRLRLSAISTSDRFLDLPLAVQSIVLKNPKDRTAKEQESLKTAQVQPDDQVKNLEKELKEFEAKFVTTLVMKELPQPRQTRIQIRGDFLNPGDTVQPAVMSFLPKLESANSTKNRLDLAQWLTRPDHPLTHRVFVNRIWQQCFGKGIVDTENDFGMQGALPTHPELLDWLASEFVREGQSLKKLYRLIVTSATYQQSSAYRTDLAEKDPNNLLWARQTRLRLEAEIIRDSALAASGLLSRKLGGPGVYPPQASEVFSFTQSRRSWTPSPGEDRYRRGMYTYLWRQSQHPLLTTFDAPDAQTACTKRNRSNTPLQALHLANDPVFVEIAEALAKRVEREGSRDDLGRIDDLFRLCLARRPQASERDRLLKFVEEQRASNPATAWVRAARVVLNLDEFITRE